MSSPSFAFPQALPILLFFGRASLAGLGDRSGLLPLNHANPVHIGDNHIARQDQRARAGHRNVDRSGGRLYCPLRMDGFRPYRKIHRRQLANVADPGVDDQSQHPVRHQRGRQQIAKHAIGRVRGCRHHQNVAGFAHLDRGVDHQVIAGLAQHRHRRARRFSRGVDRPHVRFHQAGAALRLVDRSHAQFAQNLDGLRVRPRNVSNNFVHVV